MANVPFFLFNKWVFKVLIKRFVLFFLKSLIKYYSETIWCFPYGKFFFWEKSFFPLITAGVWRTPGKKKRNTAGWWEDWTFHIFEVVAELSLAVLVKYVTLSSRQVLLSGFLQTIPLLSHKNMRIQRFWIGRFSLGSSLFKS